VITAPHFRKDHAMRSPLRPFPSVRFVVRSAKATPLALLLALASTACGDGSGTTTETTPPGPSDGGADGSSATATLDCASLVPDKPELSGSVTGEQSWSGIIPVRGRVNVGRATITIAPGTTFVMGPDSAIEFGWNGNTTTVVARGTAEQPITFCGRENRKGFWDDVAFGARVTTDSALEFVRIAHAGRADAALKLAAGVRLRDVSVIDSGSDGVRATDFGAESERLIVKGSGAAAMELQNAAAVNTLPKGSELTGNTRDAVRLSFRTIAASTTFRNVGVPYVQEQSVDVTSGAEVAFEEGVDYRFASDTKLEVGWNGNDATLSVRGSAERPVTFSGLEPRAGYWAGILVRSRVRSASRVAHAIVRHAGGAGADGVAGAAGRAAVLVQAPIALENVTLEDNKVLGVRIDQAGLAATSATLTVTRTEGPPVEVAPDALVTVPTGGRFTGNVADVIAVRAGDFRARGRVKDVGVPYRFDGTVRTVGGSELTIDPGVQAVMTSGTQLDVGWNNNDVLFSAVGTAEKPIVFRGATETVGFWGGLVLNGQVRAASRLSFVQIGHAGQGVGGAALRLAKATDVSNCRFFASTNGISKLASDTTNYAANGNTFEGITGSNVVTR
jgi:hypothetical protein